jgi:hypothetical protein
MSLFLIYRIRIKRPRVELDRIAVGCYPTAAYGLAGRDRLGVAVPVLPSVIENWMIRKKMRRIRKRIIRGMIRTIVVVLVGARSAAV